MKTCLNIAGLYIVLLSLFVFSGCKNDLDLDKKPTRFLFMLDTKHEVIKEVPVSLLAHIKKDFVIKGQADKAERIEKTYNLVTGKLRNEAIEGSKQAQPSAKARRSNFTLTFDQHVQDYGWAYNIPVNIGPNSQHTMGATFPVGLRLEAFIFHSNLDLDSRWNEPNSLCYNVYVQGSGWQGLMAQHQMSGTTGQSKALKAVWIWLGVDTGYSLYYCTNHYPGGPTAWVTNGSIAGWPNPSASDIHLIHLWFVDFGE